MIVADSDVVSELMRQAPDAAVLAWLGRHPAHDLATTAITAAEVRYGIARLPAGRRKDELLRVLEDVLTPFAEAILPFDDPAARVYASLVAERERGGRPIDGFDAQIAAICRVHGATLATRNERDFVATGVVTTNPWRTDS